MATGVVTLFCTFPTTDLAGQVATTLVEERLAACVNLIPKVTSIYRWEGEVAQETEALAIIKTTQERSPDLQKRLVELHEYKCPEVIELPVSSGLKEYLQWVGDVVGK